MNGVVVTGIISAVLLIMLGMVIGMAIVAPPEKAVEKFEMKHAIYVIAGFCGTLITVATFIGEINRCCNKRISNMEYSLEKYDMGKKTVTVEKGETIETDTVYFFKEKKQNKKIKLI